MTGEKLSDEIILYTFLGEVEAVDYDQVRGAYEETRGWASRSQRTTITSAQLQQQVNVFLLLIDSALKETPKEVGGFRLDEFEISAGITAGGKLTLLEMAGGKAEVNGELRFVFKRPG
jgi:hypothetical protein